MWTERNWPFLAAEMLVCFVFTQVSSTSGDQHSKASVISNKMLKKSSSWEAAWLCQPLLVETTSLFFISKHKKQLEY